MLDACKEAADTEFEITENFKNKVGQFPAFLTDNQANIDYGVRGSPTLVINGAQVSSGRSPSQYLATICNAFNEEPDGCDTQLSAQSYGPGFGYDIAAADAASAAVCG
ncbi:MAG: hypothetical protein V1740_05760 [Candidatus Woesearchaeota archaeon]